MRRSVSGSKKGVCARAQPNGVSFGRGPCAQTPGLSCAGYIFGCVCVRGVCVSVCVRESERVCVCVCVCVCRTRIENQAIVLVCV